MHLPHHLHPSLTIAELAHLHIAAIVAIPQIGFGFAGAALSAATNSALGTSIVQDYTAGVGTGFFPISYWAAVGLQGGLTIFFVFTYLQNSSLRKYHIMNDPSLKAAEKLTDTRGFDSSAIYAGLAIFFSVMIGIPNGLYSVGNPWITFGSYIGLGWHIPEDNSWSLDIAWFVVWGLAGWLLHLPMWNVNGLSDKEIEELHNARRGQMVEDEIKGQLLAAQYTQPAAQSSASKFD